MNVLICLHSSYEKELRFILKTLFPSIFAGSLGAVGFYYLFDKRNFEVIKTGDDYLYEKLYSEEYKKRKIKNIITSSGVVGATALIGAWIILSSFDMSGYDACFDPRCG